MACARLSFPVAHAALLICLLPATAAAQVGGADRREKDKVTWAKGTVRDEAGKPIVGAMVFARATYHGGLRMHASLLTCSSDANGRYVIEGPGGLPWFSATLVASVPGRPPALSWLSRVESHEPDSTTFEVKPAIRPQLDHDLVIPNRGGKLEVLVMKGGSPLPGASVALRLEGADPFDNWGSENQTEQHQHLYAICRPTLKTGMDGIARFDALSSGLYSILAIEGGWTSEFGLTEYQRWGLFRPKRMYGESRQVAVRSGDTSSHQIALFQHGCVAKFEVLRDGKNWMEQERLDMDGTLPSGEDGARATRIGEVGSDTFRFETAGLARVSFTRYTESRHSPRDFPFLSADGIVAASPRLSNTFPISLVADENRGGAVRVRIEDAEGRPLTGRARFRGLRRGGLLCDSGFRDVVADGSLISGFEPASGMVEAIASEVPRIVLSESQGSFPAAEDLVGRSEILPQPVTAQNNEECEVTVRPEKVGYVRGRLKPPAGRTTADYRVLVGSFDHQKGVGVSYQRDTGEFLAGPYRSGDAVLKVYAQRGQRPLQLKTVHVRAGEVTDVDLEMGDGTDELKLYQWLHRTRVLLADGTTPARLAAFAIYSPTDGEIMTGGWTDTSGAMRSRFSWSLQDNDFSEPAGTPPGPVVIAWVPGDCGAAIVPLPDRRDQPLSITLPPAISLRGRVNVEGDGATMTNGAVTVRAQYAGKGKLNDLLSVETTAGADGAFELAGLTPGKYRVQAALDGIWLSPSIEFAVVDQPLEPIALTIPQPGGPVLVRLSGHRTRPPEKLIVSRPAGPLADRLWPKHLTPDRAGVTRVPALEAGKHLVQVGKLKKVVDVPSLTESKGRPTEVEWNLEE